MKQKYRFRVAYPPHAKGDPVPDTFTEGMIATMLEYRRIEPVPEPAAETEPDTFPAEKQVEVAPSDKMMRRGKVRNK
jgi:hypothetical protein